MKFSLSQDDKRSLTFSLDACYIGFYFWIGSFTLRVGGIDVKDSGSPYFYPYIVPTFIGFGFVLPNYFSWHTPFDEFGSVDTHDLKTELLRDLTS